jgi:hypothetical protein
MRLTVSKLTPVAVLACVAAAIDRTGYLNLAVAGPVFGALLHRELGKNGILGGTIGGVLFFCGIGVVGYGRAYLSPEVYQVDYFGPFLSFLCLALGGAVFGTVVGFLFALIASEQPQTSERQRSNPMRVSGSRTSPSCR